MRSEPTIDLEPRASRGVAALLAGEAIAAALVVSTLPVDGVVRGAAVLLVALVAVALWRRHRRSTPAWLRLRADGAARWRRAHDEAPASGHLAAYVRLGPVTTLALRADDGRVDTVLVARDMVSPRRWRELSVLLGVLRPDAADSHIV